MDSKRMEEVYGKYDTRTLLKKIEELEEVNSKLKKLEKRIERLENPPKYIPAGLCGGGCP